MLRDWSCKRVAFFDMPCPCMERDHSATYCAVTHPRAGRAPQSNTSVRGRATTQSTYLPTNYMASNPCTKPQRQPQVARSTQYIQQMLTEGLVVQVCRVFVSHAVRQPQVTRSKQYIQQMLAEGLVVQLRRVFVSHAVRQPQVTQNKHYIKRMLAERLDVPVRCFSLTCRALAL